MAQDQAPPPLVILLPPDALEQLKRAPAPAPPAPVIDLTIPTIAYVAAASGAWAAAGATCVEQLCPTVTPTLPTVSDVPTAVGFGVLIQGATLWAIHQWVGPRWPKVAQAVLYGLATLHAIKAADHVSTARRRVTGTE